jgi:hypothetical protein
MKCPTCDVALVMAERAGVEIDYCPQCRGVWLDRGELDKIVARSDEAVSVAGGGLGTAARSWKHDDDQHGDHGPRRKSMWREMFD